MAALVVLISTTCTGVTSRMIPPTGLVNQIFPTPNRAYQVAQQQYSSTPVVYSTPTPVVHYSTPTPVVYSTPSSTPTPVVYSTPTPFCTPVAPTPVGSESQI